MESARRAAYRNSWRPDHDELKRQVKEEGGELYYSPNGTPMRITLEGQSIGGELLRQEKEAKAREGGSIRCLCCLANMWADSYLQNKNVKHDSMPNNNLKLRKPNAGTLTIRQGQPFMSVPSSRIIRKVNA